MILKPVLVKTDPIIYMPYKTLNSFIVGFKWPIICHEDNSVPLIKLGEKGCQGLWRASKERGDNLDAQAGQYVHKECRRIYTNPNEIQKVTREKKVTSDSASIPKLRSKSLSFDFRTHCFICGQHV
jgi:hypothetical protein